ncbi:hypothetical protein CDAR_472151 [Caerostris darwini]|uniref:Uncharacterized protein n=1 Tax=Caerostris darwini TaxID=1538125 RepID=A0AAV4VLE4_9ARAC|nr:hypothetical protein CDAR_472151 [Caerostris darwini]
MQRLFPARNRIAPFQLRLNNVSIFINSLDTASVPPTVLKLDKQVRTETVVGKSVLRFADCWNRVVCVFCQMVLGFLEFSRGSPSGLMGFFLNFPEGIHLIR